MPRPARPCRCAPTAVPIGFNEDYSLNRIWADSATATPWVAADADASAAAGATVSRTPLYWKGVQPTRGAWNWGTYDRIIGAYSGRGMRVIVNVSGTPDWAGVDDLTPFVKALAERYGTRLAGIEIYNEPNSSKYWAARPTRRCTRSSCARATAARSPPTSACRSPADRWRRT